MNLKSLVDPCFYIFFYIKDVDVKLIFAFFFIQITEKIFQRIKEIDHVSVRGRYIHVSQKWAVNKRVQLTDCAATEQTCAVKKLVYKSILTR